MRHCNSNYFSFIIIGDLYVRSDQPHIEHVAKPFDWTFTTDYQGTLLGGLQAEASDLHIDLEKLKKREQILFYSDVTLFEDELHDNGTAICSVKIVCIRMNHTNLLVLKVSFFSLNLHLTSYVYRE